MKILIGFIMILVSLALACTPSAWAGRYTFADIDYPEVGATTTTLDGISINNLGQIAGGYTKEGVRHAYFKNGDTYSTLNFSSAACAYGINDAGRAVGFFNEPGISRGFLYNTSDNTYVPVNVDVPGTHNTTVFGINDTGKSVGYYDQQHAFIYDIASGSFTYFDQEEATITNAYGINDSDQVVGYYSDGSHDHGFIYQNGSLQTFDYPGAQNSKAVGINDRGDIVGRYYDDGGVNIHGFIYTNGQFETLEAPGAEIVRVSGINNAGQIVGFYTRDGGATLHGFLATPVRGSSAILLLLLND